MKLRPTPLSCPGPQNGTQHTSLACCSCTTALQLPPLQLESFFGFIVRSSWLFPSCCDSPLSFSNITSTCCAAVPAHLAHSWSFPQLCLPFVHFSLSSNPLKVATATFKHCHAFYFFFASDFDNCTNKGMYLRSYTFLERLTWEKHWWLWTRCNEVVLHRSGPIPSNLFRGLKPAY